jgi:hypothetical protein
MIPDPDLYQTPRMLTDPTTPRQGNRVNDKLTICEGWRAVSLSAPGGGEGRVEAGLSAPAPRR